MLNYDVCKIVNENCLIKQAEKQAKREQHLAVLAGIAIAIATVILVITIFMVCKADTNTKSIPKSQICVEKQIKQKYGKRVKFYDTKDIDEYIIVTRKDKKRVVVERVTGTVINKKKDGRDTNGYYISYKGLSGIRKGSKIVSYLVYNPATYYIDDVIERIDVVVKR